jgi:hypothetical protein
MESRTVWQCHLSQARWLSWVPNRKHDSPSCERKKDDGQADSSAHGVGKECRELVRVEIRRLNRDKEPE